MVCVLLFFFIGFIVFVFVVKCVMLSWVLRCVLVLILLL